MKFLHRNWRQLFMFYRLIAFTERLPEIEFDNLDTYSDYMPRNQISLPARRKAFAEACFSESRRFKEFVSFSEAKTLLKPHKIPTRAQYLELRKSIDNRLPSKPDVVYLEWAGWPDFLQVADEKARRNKEKYLSFDECKARIAELKKVLPLNTLRDYQKFCQSHKGQGFNSNPNIYYRAVWKGWNDFLGTEKRVPIHERKTFDETKQIARLAYLQNGVDNRDKWIKYVDGLERSADYDDPPW
ncbi:hypothetical protein EBR96_09310, partial [bacterium]|nr:hypothetical protein [bacterium]